MELQTEKMENEKLYPKGELLWLFRMLSQQAGAQSHASWTAAGGGPARGMGRFHWPKPAPARGIDKFQTRISPQEPEPRWFMCDGQGGS